MGLLSSHMPSSSTGRCLDFAVALGRSAGDTAGISAVVVLGGTPTAGATLAAFFGAWLGTSWLVSPAKMYVKATFVINMKITENRRGFFCKFKYQRVCQLKEVEIVLVDGDAVNRC